MSIKVVDDIRFWARDWLVFVISTNGDQCHDVIFSLFLMHTGRESYQVFPGVYTKDLNGEASFLEEVMAVVRSRMVQM